MQEIELGGGDVKLDAQLIAGDLGLDPAQVLEAMRAGAITALCERGVEQDTGHFRLTFFHGRRRLRLLIDDEGRVLERETTNLRRPPSDSVQR